MPAFRVFMAASEAILGLPRWASIPVGQMCTFLCWFSTAFFWIRFVALVVCRVVCAMVFERVCFVQSGVLVPCLLSYARWSACGHRIAARQCVGFHHKHSWHLLGVR